MYLILMAILIVASVSLITWSALSSRPDRAEVTRMRLKTNLASLPHAARPDGGSSAGTWLREKAAPELARLVRPRSDPEQTRLRIKMANAGFRGDASLALFLAAKVVVGAGLAVFALVTSWSRHYEPQIVFGLSGLAGGVVPAPREPDAGHADGAGAEGVADLAGAAVRPCRARAVLEHEATG